MLLWTQLKAQTQAVAETGELVKKQNEQIAALEAASAKSVSLWDGLDAHLIRDCSFQLRESIETTNKEAQVKLDALVAATGALRSEKGALEARVKAQTEALAKLEQQLAAQTQTSAQLEAVRTMILPCCSARFRTRLTFLVVRLRAPRTLVFRWRLSWRRRRRL
jgi:hypothetical protein